MIPRGRDVHPDGYSWSFQIARPIAKTPGVAVRTTGFQAAGTGGGAAPIDVVHTITDPAISGFVADELSKSDRSQSHNRSGDGTSRLDIFAEILAALQGTPARYHNSCRGQLRSGLI
jgi:hypothetical protein